MQQTDRYTAEKQALFDSNKYSKVDEASVFTEKLRIWSMINIKLTNEGFFGLNIPPMQDSRKLQYSKERILLARAPRKHSCMLSSMSILRAFRKIFLLCCSLRAHDRVQQTVSSSVSK